MDAMDAHPLLTLPVLAVGEFSQRTRHIDYWILVVYTFSQRMSPNTENPEAQHLRIGVDLHRSVSRTSPICRYPFVISLNASYRKTGDQPSTMSRGKADVFLGSNHLEERLDLSNQKRQLDERAD